MTRSTDPGPRPVGRIGAVETTFSARLSAGVRTLTPGYFALVMATGIASVGLDLVGHPVPSRTLLWLAGRRTSCLWCSHCGASSPSAMPWTKAL